MRLVGLMPVRNEAWCCGLTARAALLWMDALVVLNHASTDASVNILQSVSSETGRLFIIHEASPQWDEMRHRQILLDTARYLQATHIAIVDADEILTGNLLCKVPEISNGFWHGGILELPGYNLRGSIGKYHANGIWGDRWFSTAFQDDKRLHWDGDHFHHRQPKGLELKRYRPISQGKGGIMHLWGASERRLRAKSALYKITERLRWPDKPVAEIEDMYSWAIKGSLQRTGIGTPATWTYADVPSEWWEPYAHLMPHLDVNAEPWQIAECERLVAEQGAARFAGLDLFGVV